MSEIEITQADREAAASYMEITRGFPVFYQDMREGREDDHRLVQAFARHRTQARAEALSDALKACKAAQYSPAPYTDISHAIRTLSTTP